MQTPTQLGWETEFVRVLRTHLTAVVPITTLAVKILVRVFSRDEFKDIMRSVANLPLEFMLIAMSFMLGALCGISDAYTRRFPPSDGDLYAAIVIIVIFLLSIPVNKLNRFAVTLFGKLFIAIKQYRDLTQQPLLPGSTPSMARTGRIFWAMVYCILMVLVLLLSLGISVTTLAYVLHLIQ